MGWTDRKRTRTPKVDQGIGKKGYWNVQVNVGSKAEKRHRGKREERNELSTRQPIKGGSESL
jgi:hypothetical protein